MHALDPAPVPLQPGPTPLAPRVLVGAPEGGRSSLIEGLRDQDFAVLVAPTGTLVQQVQRGEVDLVLLHLDAHAAFDQLVELREHSQVPVLVALRETRTSLERFLEAGADDCVVSGVTRGELAARVRAVLRRRARAEQGEVLRAGELVMDLGRHTLQRDGVAIHLPPKEFGLLELLLRRDGRVVSREEALQLVWGHTGQSGQTGDPTTVDVHVKRLRAKLEDDPAQPVHLLTVRGLGYRYQA